MRVVRISQKRFACSIQFRLVDLCNAGQPIPGWLKDTCSARLFLAYCAESRQVFRFETKQVAPCSGSQHLLAIE
jgi:hypothetical protein